MEKNKKIGYMVAGLVVLVIVFYAGMTYGGNNVRAAISNRSQNFGQNAGTLGARGGRNMAGGFVNGQIISKDATSITVQLMMGGPNEATGAGSKIVFFDSNTKITKQASGSLSDLSVGTQVSVTGTPNTDGSVNAQTVQLRPAFAQPVVK